jgi:hypothetical protein
LLKIPCLDFGEHHENFVSIRFHLQRGSRRVPDLGFKKDCMTCASRSEAGHCREGEGRSFIARDALRSISKEFYVIDTQRLNQLWQKCDENDANFVEK